MSQLCLLCRVNETREMTTNKVCDECSENAADFLERHAEHIAAAIPSGKNTTPPAHTPTPWAAFGDTGGELRVVDAQDVTVATCWRQSHDPAAWAEGNAAFIVRACNSHDALRTASKDLYGRLQEYFDVSDEQLTEQGHGNLVKAMDDLVAAWHTADGTQPDEA